MERKLLKKEIEKLLREYVSTTLREKEFDPKGRKESTFLDDMAHYDLALGVALQWLSSSEDIKALKNGKIKLQQSLYKYPNRMEREAMILSSFAGMLMDRFPVEDVFEIYKIKPAAMQLQSSAKSHRTQPFNLSLHPFAMLTAHQAAEHAWKHRTRVHKSICMTDTNTKQEQNIMIGQQNPNQGSKNQHMDSADGMELSSESVTEEEKEIV
ncbi:uncharacterized protein C2orf80 homolog [Bombina bombina]|uniref:uncharacterized protein C2orf80 homolog n=1 Tax=Bombina bombina TaxID=8345 RepID=UPI00235A6782|nr:uncharacterized protein C2orf80 homolog [Bombina bombina]